MDINVARFHQALSRLFDAKGHGGGLTALDDVMPVVEIIPGESPEMSFPRDEVLFTSYSGAIGAVAGQVGRALFTPPPGSMVRVDMVQAYAAQPSLLGATLVQPGTLLGAAPANAIVAPTDGRWHRMTLGPSVWTSDTNASPDASFTYRAPIGVCSVAAGAAAVIPTTPCILTDDVSLLLVNYTANAGCQFYVSGMIRLSPSPNEMR
jgi:hypothetical protein